MRCTLVPVLLPLLFAALASAWNVTGHEIVAAETYDILAKTHPKTLTKILTLLKQNPLKDFEADQIEL